MWWGWGVGGVQGRGVHSGGWGIGGVPGNGGGSGWGLEGCQGRGGFRVGVGGLEGCQGRGVQGGGWRVPGKGGFRVGGRRAARKGFRVSITHIVTELGLFPTLRLVMSAYWTLPRSPVLFRCTHHQTVTDTVQWSTVLAQIQLKTPIMLSDVPRLQRGVDQLCADIQVRHVQWRLGHQREVPNPGLDWSRPVAPPSPTWLPWWPGHAAPLHSRWAAHVWSQVCGNWVKGLTCVGTVEHLFQHHSWLFIFLNYKYSLTHAEPC